MRELSLRTLAFHGRLIKEDELCVSLKIKSRRSRPLGYRVMRATFAETSAIDVKILSLQHSRFTFPSFCPFEVCELFYINDYL